MNSSETYSVSMDTANGSVSEPLLLAEILDASLTTTLLGTRVDGDVLTITFLSSLGSEKPTVDAIVASHQGPISVINDISVTATNTVSTTSTTYILIPSMSIVPGAGSYIVSFSATGGVNSSAGNGFISIYSNNSLVPNSTREISASVFFFGINTLIEHNLNTQAVVTIDDGQSIQARYRSTSSLELRNRSLVLTKLD